MLRYIVCLFGLHWLYFCGQGLRLSSLHLDFDIPTDDEDICATSLIHAIKSSFNLLSFTTHPLRRLLADEEESEEEEMPRLLPRKSIADCKGILDMNKAGRRYILVDPWNKAKGFDVLAAAPDKVTCLFLRLLENPFLCYAVNRK